MTMWVMILWGVLAFLTAAVFYLGFRVPKLFDFGTIAEWDRFKQFSLGLLVTLGVSGLITLCLDFVNAVVCVMYAAMIWLVSDLVFWLIEKIGHVHFEHYYAGWVAMVLTVLALGAGWYFNHHVWKTNYNLTTPKNIDNLRVVMFADSHIGTSFDGKKFAKHVEAMQAQNPDVAVVVGDYVDDGTSKEDMITATEALGKLKTKYGIYFVFGNHDKGYYGPERRGFSFLDLYKELEKNGIKVLVDETMLIDDRFYIIGRRDFSEVKEQRGYRKSMADLVKDLDKNKYMIVLDHQPTEFDKQAAAEVDLVLSGHTHGGQLLPFNQVGKWIGANDAIYGHERRGQTDFVVTSGISAWAIKFKTGTKSEFVVIDIAKQQ